MNLDEARTVAKQMAGHFRAFARLGEFLEEVAAREAELSTAQQRLADAKKDTAAQEETLAALTKQVGDLHASIRELSDAFQISQVKTRKLLRDNEALVEEDLANRKAKADKEYAESIKQQADRLVALTKQVDAKTVELERLNNAIAEMKKKIAGVV